LTTETDMTKSVDIGVDKAPDTPPAPAADDQKADAAQAEGQPEGEAKEAQDSEKSDETEQQQEQKKSRFQRRLERQKEGRIRAETEARMLREQLAALNGRKEQPQDAGEPKRESFDDYESYIEAKATYNAKLAARAEIEAERQQAKQQGERERSNASQEKIAQRWTTVEQEFSKTHKDYEAVVTPFVEDDLGTFSEVARLAIVESDLGPQVLYHLANNPEDADRLANLSPTQQVKELGRLELKLSIPAKDKSKAPSPPSHERGNRNAAHGYSDNMSDAEYREWRKTQGARWAR